MKLTIFLRPVLFMLLIYYALPGIATPVLLVVGDSLSAAYGLQSEQGWVSLLSERLQERHIDYSIVNASVTGAVTADGLRDLPTLLQTYKPKIVMIELGYNDGGRGYPIMVIKQNLAKMIQLAQKAKAEVLLLGGKLPANYGTAYVDAFSQVYVDLADKYDIKRVPFFLQGFAEDRNFFQPDGVHPTAEAQPIILDNVWKYLQPMLK